MSLAEILMMLIAIFAGADDPSSSVKNGSVSREALVVDSIDGDTITVSKDSRSYDVRLIGVDTPEKYGSVNPGEFGVSKSCLEKYSARASSFTEDWEGRYVNLTGDPTVDNKGSYGRYLRYVKYNNRSLNRLLVKNGLARVYTESDFSMESEFVRLQSVAKRKDRGIWSCN